MLTPDQARKTQEQQIDGVVQLLRDKMMAHRNIGKALKKKSMSLWKKSAGLTAWFKA
jgi:hypothetical protein